MGWIGKLPIVSLSIVGAMLVVPLGPWQDLDPSNLRFEAAREEARSHFQRNPTLRVDEVGEGVLDPSWLEQTRETAREEGSDEGIALPTRLQRRSQAQLDELIDQAYRTRLETDPAWRLGVLDAQSPPWNYLAHAFVHETWAGLALVVAVLILAGTPLERAWGSLFFAGFVLGSLPLTAWIHHLLDASSGLPWSGGAGLAGALLGAYFVRGLGGSFLLPGWVLLPTWLGLEVFGIRGFWLDDLGGVPWATLVCAIGLGALVAGLSRLLGVESKLDALAELRAEDGPNPVLMRAARLRTDGDPNQAFDLIQAAWRDDPRDDEMAEAFFEIAVEVGRPQAAAAAILPSVGKLLRAGNVARALEYWLPLATAEADVALEGTAALRLAEALLDAGHPEEALFSLRLALFGGVSSAQATRIVRVARDLDGELARRAAQVALADPSLDPDIRADLASMVSPELLGRSVPPMTAGESGTVDAQEASLIAQDLDPGALSAESLGAGDTALPVDPGVGPGSQPGDILSHWNDPRLIDDLSDALAVDGPPDRELFSSEDLESIDAGLDLPDELGTRQDADRRMLDPREAETDGDMTPMMDVTIELGTPASRRDVEARVGSGPTSEVSRIKPPDPPMPAAPERPLRRLKALDAVPISAGGRWVEIDVDTRGKSRLPISRVEAIAMAAVVGLAPRPVLIVDFALNWHEDPDEALKVIRFRSDRFDPRRFEKSAASPLEALLLWLKRIQSESDALCLPSREMLEGRFARFDSLGLYAREVLQARSLREPTAAH